MSHGFYHSNLCPFIVTKRTIITLPLYHTLSLPNAAVKTKPLTLVPVTSSTHWCCLAAAAGAADDDAVDATAAGPAPTCDLR